MYNLTCVRVVAIGSSSNSNYIISIVKLVATNCIKATIVRANLDHIKFEVIVIATSDNKVEVTRTKSNPSTNNCTIVNKSIRRTTTNYIYNKEFNNASI
jgi:hypothetical protein